MRERVERLVGGVSRGDVGDDLPLGLRADPARRRRAARLHARLHDLRRGRLAADGQALHGRARRRPEALPAARGTRRRSRAPRTSCSTRRPTPPTREAAPGRSFFERTVADVYELYERRMLEANAMDFDDLLVRTVNLLELFEDVRERYRRAFRRVLVDEYQDTNRAQYRLLQLLVGGARQPDRRRRRRPVDLLLPGRRHPQHPRVRARLPRRRRSSSSSRTTARPRRSSTPPTRSSPTTASAAAEAPLDRRRPAASRCTSPSSTTSTRRRATSPPRSSGSPSEEGIPRDDDRGLLPGQRAEPGARGHAGPLRGPLPGDRRDQVLRAGRDQGRGRLPEPAREPGRRRVSSRGSSTRRAAGSARPPRPGCSPTPTRPARTIWEVVLASRSGCPASAPPRCKCGGAGSPS